MLRVASANGLLLGKVRCRGPFLEDDRGRVSVRGFTWGPFRGLRQGEYYPSPARARADLAAMVRAGANVVRVYTPPPRWVLDEIEASGLRVLVGLPWNQHVCFLENRRDAAAIRTRIRTEVEALRHPALFGCTLANEVPETVVRWYGARRVGEFLGDLIAEARAAAPDALHTFATFPPTEDLATVPADLVLANVHLNDAGSLDAYLARLLTIADGRPLVLGEIGADAGTHGEAAQAAHIEDQLRVAWRRGAAGAFVFSWTDEWFVPSADGGHDIEGWSFGVTTADRRPKPALAAASRAFMPSPQETPEACGVTVVVCARNAEDTIEAALHSLVRLRYEPVEVLVIDDGSTDATAARAEAIPGVRVVRTPPQGLSAARNRGAAEARHEVIAYTDADCVADPDWLKWIVPVIAGNVVAAGGPNLSMPHPGRLYATLAAAPGAPTHVLTSHDRAEHLAGCNLVVRRDALTSIGGFDPQFTSAGDDADFCWRLLDAGFQIGFAPLGVVWHERRRTVRRYLRQQRGYGRAEASLRTRHARRCSPGGTPGWTGLIYGGDGSGPLWGSEPVIYRQAFGTLGYLGIYGSHADHAFRSVVLAPEWLVGGLLAALAGLVDGAAVTTAGVAMLLPTMVAAVREARARARVSAAAFERSRADDSPPGVHLALLTWLVLAGRTVRRYGQMRALAERGLALSLVRGESSGPSGRGRWRRRLSWARSFEWRGETWWEHSPEPGEVLDSLVTELERQQLDPVSGGGYAPFDFRALCGLWWRIDGRAVVEEHGAGRRMMRFAFRPRLPATALIILVPFLPLLVTSLLEGGWLGVGLASGAVAAFFTGAARTLGGGRRRVLAALERVAAASGGMVLERGRVARLPVPERVLQPVPEAEVPEPIIGVAGGR